MAKENMSIEQIEEAIDEVGETGSWKLKGSDLHTQREENADWLYIGTVADVEEASAYLEQRQNA